MTTPEKRTMFRMLKIRKIKSGEITAAGAMRRRQKNTPKSHRYSLFNQIMRIHELFSMKVITVTPPFSPS